MSSISVGPDLALALLGTAPVNRGTEPPAARGHADLVANPSDALAWCAAHGLPIPPRWHASPPAQRELQRELVDLRHQVQEMVERLVAREGVPRSVVASLDRCLEEERATTRVAAGEDGEWRLHTERTPGTARGVLALIAHSGLALLLEANPVRIRPCASERCRRWFYDTSRNGSRKWCSMERCGNRQKARRHYRRQKVSAQEP